MAMVYRTAAVTGASGFIGGHLALQLLDRGYVVHATVRRNTPEKAAHLTGHPAAGERLRVFEADLEDEGSFDAALAGCDVVFHVASPFTMHARDVVRDLVNPAVRGMENVLRGCMAARSVRRVVMTSSFGAVHTSRGWNVSADKMGYVHTEADWNDMANERFLPYFYSKVLAERAAWAFMSGDQENHPKPEFDLVVINPVMVYGPLPHKGAFAESVATLADILNGKFFGVSNSVFPVVDVRDVALAHILAAESPAANGRYICSAQTGGEMTHAWDVTKAAKRFGLQPPERDFTGPWATAAIRVASFLLPGQMGQMVRTSLNKRYDLSNRKIVADLGMKFRPVDETMQDTFASLVEHGYVKMPESPNGAPS